MRRRFNTVRADWLLPKNEALAFTKDGKPKRAKCYKFNKNVSDREKERYRRENFRIKIS